MNNVNKIEKCICCDGNDLNILLDLNEQPLANSYHDNTKKLEKYPLGVNLCNYCYHIQLTHSVNPDFLFRDYLYVSGTSETLRENFDWFSNFVLEYSPIVRNVLDIACNDGTQLDYFREKGVDTFGIDPAENLYEDCKKKGHNVQCEYFDSNLYHSSTTFDTIIAQNVFAHNKDAFKFLNDCSDLMNDNSLLFVQTSQSHMIMENQFDTIYHEHISFFNINSFNELVKRTNLNLIDVVKTPVHGISYLFILSKKDLNKYKIKNLIDVEREEGLVDNKTYEIYKENVLNITREFIDDIKLAKEQGYKLVGYGAAAKGMTFLNFTNIKLDYIIDDNPLKQNLFTPGTNIEIKSAEFLKTYSDDDKILFIPLAWNFFNEIKTRILNVRDNKNDMFLKYFPKVMRESI